MRMNPEWYTSGAEWFIGSKHATGGDWFRAPNELYRPNSNNVSPNLTTKHPKTLTEIVIQWVWHGVDIYVFHTQPQVILVIRVWKTLCLTGILFPRLLFLTVWPWTSSVGTTWECVRNAHSWKAPTPTPPPHPRLGALDQKLQVGQRSVCSQVFQLVWKPWQ